MNLKQLSLNQTSKDTTSDKSNSSNTVESKLETKSKSNITPDWLNKDADYAINMNFQIASENFVKVFEAVKNSTLPQKVIQYLTQDEDVASMLIAAGFGFRVFPAPSNTSISYREHLKINDPPRSLEDLGKLSPLYPTEFRPILGKYYTFEFFNIIAPFVADSSYVECMSSFNDWYRWVFKDSKCYIIEPKIIWEI